MRIPWRLKILADDFSCRTLEPLGDQPQHLAEVLARRLGSEATGIVACRKSREERLASRLLIR